LQNYAGDSPILLDDFIEQNWCYRHRPLSRNTPWVGIFHHPPFPPEFSNRREWLHRVFKTDLWKESQSQLKLAIALTEYLGNWLREQLPCPVHVLKHPCEQPATGWLPEQWHRNSSKQIVSMGWHLRNTQILQQIPPINGVAKRRLLSTKTHVKQWDKQVSSLWSGRRRHWGDVIESGYIPKLELDEMLRANVFAMEVFDASANNVLLDCIAFRTPIFVNRHPAMVEHLGEDYPLYFDHPEQIPDLMGRVEDAHHHMNRLDLSWMSGERFAMTVADAVERLRIPKAHRGSSRHSWKPPHAGLLSPGEQRVIQIEITNACPKRCSNCTRLVSHVRHPFNMEESTFRQAVDSLAGYSGMVGIMGGEPTLHPQFDAMCRYYRKALGNIRISGGRDPILDYGRFRTRERGKVAGKTGLWSATGEGYYRHLELIHDTFSYLCLNDHQNEGKHQALLIARKDLGIDDETWERLRNNCWIQRNWSASINPAGAYFCEVAAAIDLLFCEGKHAWPIETGWWKRTPDEFGEQIDLCEHCSAPLQVPRTEARKELDVVSLSNWQRLVDIGAPSVRQGRIQVVDSDSCAKDETHPSSAWYLPRTSSGGTDEAARISSANRSMYAKRLDGLTVCVGYAKWLALGLEHNSALFDRLAVVTTSTDTDTQDLARRHGITTVVSDRCYEAHSPFNKGRLLNDGLRLLKPSDWVVLFDADILLPPTLRLWTFSHVLNPGCLYWTHRYHTNRISDVESLTHNWSHIRQLSIRYRGGDLRAWGFFHLVNARAEALAGDTAWMNESFPTASSVDVNFLWKWPKNKRICIEDGTRKNAVVHIPHGRPAVHWHGVSKCPDPNHWRIVSVTDGATPWYHYRPHYPCYIKLVNVLTGDAVVQRMESKHDGPVAARHRGATQFGFESQGRIRWGFTDNGRHGQIAVWNGNQVPMTQFDMYAIGALPEGDRQFLRGD